MIQMEKDINQHVLDHMNHEIPQLPTEYRNQVSDGYHTFGELYEHRIQLFIALCKVLHCHEYAADGGSPVWRSKLHHDGTGYEGWFIMGIYVLAQQVSYHLPLSKWNETDFAKTLERAPEWDGHTPADVLERLKSI